MATRTAATTARPRDQSTHCAAPNSCRFGSDWQASDWRCPGRRPTPHRSADGVGLSSPVKRSPRITADPAGSTTAYLVEAGGKPVPDHHPAVFLYSINHKSRVIANRDGVRVIVRIVLPIRDVDRIFPQLFDALIDQSSGVFGEVVVLPLSLLAAKHPPVTRHLLPNPVSVLVLVPTDQAAGVTSPCALEVLAFLVGERVRFHYGHRLPVLQNRLRFR